MTSNAVQVSWLAKITGSVGAGHEESSSQETRKYQEEEAMRLQRNQYVKLYFTL